MPNSVSIQHASHNGEENMNLCETCGRSFKKTIRLNNLSPDHEGTYFACPFCFSKVDVLPEVPETSSALPSKKPETLSSKNDIDLKSSEDENCLHHFGYLKKRPKNEPIPDVCLTCKKMIDCLL